MLKYNKFTKYIGILAVVLVIGFSQDVSGLNYTTCEKEKPSGEVIDIKINSCESTTDRCVFIRDSNKTIDLDFKPKKDINEVKVKVFGKLKTLPVPFNINPDKACGNYGFDCPLKEGESYKFHMTMPILRTYPKINVDVVMKLVDENNSPIVCVEIPAMIREPQKE